MREKQIESYLRDQVKKIKGIAYKFESPGNSGVPDRLVLLPGGKAYFVELKAPGKKSRPLQIAQQRKISNLGFPVLEIDSKEGVDIFIHTVRGDTN
ncbi:VRR-NUC domain-containing protein [Bacillus sp. ISL-40]|uniref:VRR-NUC domain-containing protein n=1 Tax=unclassified Bacillus (in: firmicutes) TaxID=185979 RepID=UPI001BECE17C|nr:MULTISPECIES: VRR-NUC domain-containing protein [unclassified Bacillus (in: firmicutes)]MBT2696361.1 VRR-NUC domain-containing protein [Bacillus sp. ISL-40]MBT2743210.1 VRR-NUC domain-containing protein [Bacillus sp. ISL-77]